MCRLGEIYLTLILPSPSHAARLKFSALRFCFSFHLRLEMSSSRLDPLDMMARQIPQSSGASLRDA